MPSYIYINPKTNETVEVVQGMNDEHVFVGPDGTKYDRVFSNPLTAVDTKVDPFSKEDFMRRTNKRCTIGNMMDESAELSEKRARITGTDPLKQKAFDDYQKKTGKLHPEDKPKKIETKDVVIEF